MLIAGGVMCVHAVSGGLLIPAGKSVDLEPHANDHLMLSGLKAPLMDGMELPLTLRFAKAADVHVEVPVLRIESRGPAPKPAHMDHH